MKLERFLARFSILMIFTGFGEFILGSIYNKFNLSMVGLTNIVLGEISSGITLGKYLKLRKDLEEIAIERYDNQFYLGERNYKEN